MQKGKRLRHVSAMTSASDPWTASLPSESMECQAFKSEQAALAWLAEQILG